MDAAGAEPEVGRENAYGIEGLVDVTPIGSGGSARVYRATQTAFDRTVAVKILNASDDQIQRRFDRERRAMGRLSNHPGIVPVYSSGTTTLGQPYLIMPFYGSGSLADRLEREGPVRWNDATSMMSGVAAAIAHAHDHDVLHLDLKPANVMLADGGSPLVADFGIAKILSDNTARGTTNTSFTPIFCPPEIILGDKPGHAADVYGLGATLWALIAGTGPFVVDGEGKNAIAAVMHRVVTDPPADLRHLAPGWVCDIIEQAMAKDPGARPPSARQLADLLSGAATAPLPSPLSSPPLSPASSPAPPAPTAPLSNPAPATPTSWAPAASGPTGPPTDQAPTSVPASTGPQDAHTLQAPLDARHPAGPPNDRDDSDPPLKIIAAVVGLLLLGLVGYGITRLLLADDSERTAGDGDLVSQVTSVSDQTTDNPPSTSDDSTDDTTAADDSSTSETTADDNSEVSLTAPGTSLPETTASTTSTTEPTTEPAPTETTAGGAVGNGPLSGDHGLTLQWISWEPDEWGTVRFEPVDDGTYTVRGRQDGPTGEYVSVDGVMTQISDTELRFEGRIETFVEFGNNGEVCVREGVMTFLSTQNRQYWRLQDLLNCDGILTDYVDIYF